MHVTRTGGGILTIAWYRLSDTIFGIPQAHVLLEKAKPDLKKVE